MLIYNQQARRKRCRNVSYTDEKCRHMDIMLRDDLKQKIQEVKLLSNGTCALKCVNYLLRRNDDFLFL